MIINGDYYPEIKIECELCEGSGRIYKPVGFVLENGVGDIHTVSEDCPDCDGNGFIRYDSEYLPGCCDTLEEKYL